MAKIKVPSTVKKTTKKPVAAPKAKTIIKPTKKPALSKEQIEESIRLKAYELYQLRMGQDGNSLSDWLNAEKIILQGK